MPLPTCSWLLWARPVRLGLQGLAQVFLCQNVVISVFLRYAVVQNGL